MRASQTLQLVPRSSMGYSESPLVRAYDQHMRERDYAERTIGARAAFLANRLREWGTIAVTPETLLSYLCRFKGHTRRTYHDHAQALYLWAEATGLVSPNPMSEIPRPPTPKPRPRPLSRDDAAKSLLAAGGDMRAYLILGRYAGLRAHEIAKFRGEDVDESSLFVYGKGRQPFVLPTHPAIWELAQSYPREGFWFPSARSTSGHITAHALTTRVSRHFARLGIDGSSHRNRHLYGTNLLRAGANIRVVQELMRHADISTTIRYLGVDQEEKVAAIHALIA